MQLSARQHGRFHAGTACEAVKSPTVRKLEQQERNLRFLQLRAVFAHRDDAEAERIRRRIRAMGGTPCA